MILQKWITFAGNVKSGRGGLRLTMHRSMRPPLQTDEFIPRMQVTWECMKRSRPIIPRLGGERNGRRGTADSGREQPSIAWIRTTFNSLEPPGGRRISPLHESHSAVSLPPDMRCTAPAITTNPHKLIWLCRYLIL